LSKDVEDVPAFDVIERRRVRPSGWRRKFSVDRRHLQIRSGRKNDGAFDEMLKFSDVARP
jgi:hypothetical protein